MRTTRQRLIDAALALFGTQGVTETTTKQIAELAAVNEVTLFRQFGNKYGLLLAVIEEAAVFSHLGQTLIRQADQAMSLPQALKAYATDCLQALEQVPEVVRSVIGEAGQYPAENRRALGQGLTQANQDVAAYFTTVIERGEINTHLSAEQLASLLHGMLLGYAVIEFTSELHCLWRDREDFLDQVVTLFLQGVMGSGSTPMLMNASPGRLNAAPGPIVDLPATLVHTVLQQAKQTSLQDYAIAYILFGAGLSAAEVVGLRRSHYLNSPQQSLLQVGDRQVPLHQWILGKRYGTYSKNPLTQWLKSRKDAQPELFLTAEGGGLSGAALQQHWQTWTIDRLNLDESPLRLEQTQQTWCVEMLMRGMPLEDLQLLIGWPLAQLQPYAQRAREKAALEQAVRLDQKT
jgi:AcrR family transcriptional regulator